MTAQNVTVLGNGIIGLACAYHLAKDGRQVTVIDRAPVDQGTSIGNAGGIASASVHPIAEPGLWKKVPGMLMDPLGPLHFRLSHLPALMPWMLRFLQACSPENYARGIDAMGALMMRTLPDHQALLEDAKLTHVLTGEGVLYVYRSEAARDAGAARWAQKEKFGIEAFPLNRDGVRQHEPCLGEEAAAGFYSPNWAHYRDPLEMLKGLAALLRGRGVAFETAEIAGLHTAHDRVDALLTADGRTLPVESLVIAAGAWSGQLSKQLNERFPIEADRGYNTTLPAPGIDLKNYVTFAEDSFVATPMSMGLRIGGAVEMGGLTAPPNYKRADALAALAKRYLPDLNIEGGTRWMGHRPGTPDSIPVISRSATAANVLYAFGHGHLGLTMSVTTGRLIADLLAGRDPGIDMTPYRIDRYT